MTKKKQPEVRLKIDRLDIRISIDGTLYGIAELVKQHAELLERVREADERSRELFEENSNLKAVNAGLQATLDSYESDIAR